MQSKSKKIEQGDATREALLLAARELFGMRGYTETSLDEIVRTAGVTKGALYHHFASKEALFRCVFELVKKELSYQAFPQSFGQVDAEIWLDLLARCRRFIAVHTDPRVHRIVLLDARSVLTWDEWHKVENEYGVVMLRFGLRRAINRGIIRPLPLHALTMILTGALNEACMLVANAADHTSALDEASAIIEQLLEGLRPRPPAELDEAPGR
jgi:AcrR family transcriptional regulator